MPRGVVNGDSPWHAQLRPGNVAWLSHDPICAARAVPHAIVRCLVGCAEDGVACGHPPITQPPSTTADMTGGRGLIDTTTSVKGMLSVLESGRDLNGQFIAWDDKSIPW